MNKKQKRWRNRIIVALALFTAIFALELTGVLERAFGEENALYAEFALFLIPRARRTANAAIPYSSSASCNLRLMRPSPFSRGRPSGRRAWPSALPGLFSRPGA